MDDFTDGIKKLLLAGLGAAATTSEKSKELLDKLVAKGKLTVEQGKQLSKDLKAKREEEKAAAQSQARKASASDIIARMTPEERAELKAQLEALEAAPEEEAPAEEAPAEEAPVEETPAEEEKTAE